MVESDLSRFLGIRKSCLLKRPTVMETFQGTEVASEKEAFRWGDSVRETGALLCTDELRPRSSKLGCGICGRLNWKDRHHILGGRFEKHLILDNWEKFQIF